METTLPLSFVQTVLLPGTETARKREHWSFARVCGGFGYLLREGQPQALSQGDVLLVPASGSVRLRASQLSALALCHFEICPAELPGLFTVAEERALAQAAQQGRVAVRVLGADAPLAARFAALCGLREREPALVLRAEMLRLAAQTLHEAVRTPLPVAAGSPEQRLRQLLAQTPAADLVAKPARELARRCGCSERHFRRLFKAEFGQSLRAWQVQSRVRKAARLLRESDSKVVDVALECGFQHLSEFNAAFKRILGKTPSAWREARARRHRPVLCLRSSEVGARSTPAWWRELRAAEPVRC